MDTKDQVNAILCAINDKEVTWDETFIRLRQIVGVESKEPKIVQIETIYDHGENGRYQPHVKVFALYDDGTVKQSSPSFISEGWQPYAPSITPDIPQDAPAEPDPIRKRLSPESEDTRALILIKGVVDDCSLDVPESLRQIRGILADADPIAELEAMGGRLIGYEDGLSYYAQDARGVVLAEKVDQSGQLADLRAAAARLLARVRGGGA